MNLIHDRRGAGRQGFSTTKNTKNTNGAGSRRPYKPVMARLVRATHDHRATPVCMGPPHWLLRASASQSAALQRGMTIRFALRVRAFRVFRGSKTFGPRLGRVRVIRGILILVALAAVVAAAFVLAGEPGRASVEWLGWRVDMTAAAAALAIIIGAFLAVGLWRLALWIVETPAPPGRSPAPDLRRRRGLEALSAAASSPPPPATAPRPAASPSRRASWSRTRPALVRILAAQAAEAAGDPAAAQAAYADMLGFPEMKLAGHRGLMQAAAAPGDHEAALRHAKAAYGLARTSRWAWRALLETASKAATGPRRSSSSQGGPRAQDRLADQRRARPRRPALPPPPPAWRPTPGPAARAQALDYATQSARLDPGLPARRQSSPPACSSPTAAPAAPAR